MMEKAMNTTDRNNAARRRQAADEAADEKDTYQEFWTAFKHYYEARQTTLRLRKPPRNYAYTTHPIGDGAIRINAWISKPQHNVVCELFLTGPHRLAVFRALQRQRDAIEGETGGLKWEDTFPVNYSIQKIHHGSDITEQEGWPEAHRWLEEQCELFYRVFAQRVLAAEQEAVDRPGS
jgi:hypothetical protein